MLLTSFDVWLPRQRSNASDDLLAMVNPYHFEAELEFVRRLPVDADEASRLVCHEIDYLQPDAIVCCGMAESRGKLTVERRARREEEELSTLIDLPQVTAGLECEISDDAGQFVCEALYFSVLKHLCERLWLTPAVFVHVPVLTRQNRAAVSQDFSALLERLSAVSLVA